ncbi:ATP-dependent helicase [bacterium]|nr:ATP-dependent helicase [bacterium]
MENGLMPKAIISNRIYLDINPQLQQTLVKALTYKIKKNIPGATHFTQFEIIKNYKFVGQNAMSIPVGRQDLIPLDYEIIDKRILNELPFPNPRLALRDSQVEVYNEVDDTCFINALVGWGKTFCALHIARKLGQKTLIVCHNTMLRDQWADEVEKLYGMPVGQIGSGVFDIDHSIVIGNIQTLTKVTAKISKEFGTVIIDEAHHCPATTFTAFIDGMYARYKIGLSGTMSRKDGKHILFKDFFGPKLYQPPVSNTMTPTVQIIKTGIALAQGEPWVKKMNILLYDEDYQAIIARIADLQIAKGHKVLIIADRVEFLQRVGELIGEQCVCITGGTTYEERNELKRQIEDGEKSCIAGSRQIFAEGISVNILSCVILAAPIANDATLEQIIGRIMRQHEGKLNPLVIDMNFSGPADRKQNRDRQAFYSRKGWEVVGA